MQLHRRVDHLQSSIPSQLERRLTSLEGDIEAVKQLENRLARLERITLLQLDPKILELESRLTQKVELRIARCEKSTLQLERTIRQIRGK